MLRSGGDVLDDPLWTFLGKDIGEDTIKGFCQLNGMNPKWSAFASPVRTSSCTYHLLPNLECLGPQNAIVDRLQQVAAKAEEILGEPVECQKLLSLTR